MRLRQLRFANSRVALLSSPILTSSRTFSFHHRHRRRRRSFSVKVSRIPKSAFVRTHYSAKPLALKRETFTSLSARRNFLPLPSLPRSFRHCRRGPTTSNGTKRHSDSLGEIKPRPIRYSEISHPRN